jgi:hypothetical protein
MLKGSKPRPRYRTVSKENRLGPIHPPFIAVLHLGVRPSVGVAQEQKALVRLAGALVYKTPYCFCASLIVSPTGKDDFSSPTIVSQRLGLSQCKIQYLFATQYTPRRLGTGPERN